MPDGDAAARRAAADANLVEAFDLVRRHGPAGAGARHDFGRAIAIASGYPVGYFNPVFALDRATTPGDVLAAIRWIQERGLPVSARVMDGTDPGIEAQLANAGYERDPDPETVMVLDSIPDAPPAPANARVRAGGAEIVDDWLVALEAGELLRAILNPRLVADPDVRISVLDVDGDPVAGAMAFRWGDSVGIYSVATIERARRRGFGAAVTWSAIEAGRQAWGSRFAVLQSSAMGRSVYASMGFEEIGLLRVFARATA